MVFFFSPGHKWSVFWCIWSKTETSCKCTRWQRFLICDQNTKGRSTKSKQHIWRAWHIFLFYLVDLDVFTLIIWPWFNKLENHRAKSGDKAWLRFCFPLWRLAHSLLTVRCSSTWASKRPWKTVSGTASSSMMWIIYLRMTETITAVERCHVILQRSWINTCICE